ncbi:MAG: EAL domain-containing protein, partial [Myxococcales bacterium]|nr:EAL domain-containing protein [Myxococcales bacterium]
PASLSIAVALPDHKEVRAVSLLRAADTALTRARRISGGSGYQIYDSYMQTRTLRRLTLGTELRYALERDEFSVAYQPIVAIADGLIVGFEALVRWNHPQLGFVSPGEFVPVAEESGLVVPIDRWVLSRACRDIARWNGGRSRKKPLTVHVNLSAHQFAEDDLVDCIVETMSQSGAEVSMLHLEITESTLMQDTFRAVEVIRQLRAMGLRVALDDFGTGYSSLSYLHLFPLDYLKIDRMFVSQVEAGERDRKFVQVMLDLAETMQLVPIAEGVETTAQRDCLRELGCGHAQGYLYSKPVSVQEVDALIAVGSIAV